MLRFSLIVLFCLYITGCSEDEVPISNDAGTSNDSARTDNIASNDRLMKCADCGKGVSKRAVSCPHCGAPLRTNSLNEASPSAASPTTDIQEEPQTLDEFGMSLLAAVKTKDPGPFFDMFLRHEELYWLEDHILNAIEDPLKKAKYEEGIKLRIAPDKKEAVRWKAEWRKDVIEFFTLVENGEAVLTFEQLKNAIYLGMAGREDERQNERLSAQTGVSLKDIGVIMLHMPGIYIGMQGRVYKIRLNETLTHLNGHWRLGGDVKPSLDFLFDRRFEPDGLSAAEMKTTLATMGLERVYQYLSDQPVPPQEHEQRIIDGRKVAIAETQLQMLSLPLTKFQFDTGDFPSNDAGLDALRTEPGDVIEEQWRGPYLQKSIPMDPWGSDYQYVLEPDPQTNRLGFRIWSNGVDGQSGTGDDVIVTSWSLQSKGNDRERVFLEMWEDKPENRLSDYQKRLIEESKANQGPPDYSHLAVGPLAQPEEEKNSGESMDDPSEGGEDGNGSPRGSGGRSFDPEQIFDDRDEDMDGLLSGDEISERMQSRVAEMDEDNDGAISKAEFLAAIQRFRSSREDGGAPEGGGDTEGPE